jgi:hypothetical protein
MMRNGASVKNFADLSIHALTAHLQDVAATLLSHNLIFI